MHVSWLKMERYALGEVGPAELAEIDVHLHGCEACQARLDEIRGDLEPMPELPVVLPERRSRGGVLALAAAAVLVAVAMPRSGELPGATVAYKGGELALEVVRERDGALSRGATTYRDGDRLAVELSCPPGEADWALVVWQGDERVEPFDSSAPLVCGNGVALGAIEVSGPGEITICAVLDPVGALSEPGALPAAAACTVLEEQ